MPTQVITWNTTKTAAGYEWRVYSFGYQIPETTLKTGVRTTRAKATLQARKWTRFLKAEQARALNARAG